MRRKIALLITAALLLCSAAASAKVEIKSQWKGARVAFLGDSITDKRQVETTNNTYWNFLVDILGIKPYVYGRNGHRMNQMIAQGEKLEAEHGQDVDAIFVFVGTNDYNAGIPMGEWFSYDTATTIEDGNVSVERRHREMNFDESTFKGRTNCYPAVDQDPLPHQANHPSDPAAPRLRDLWRGQHPATRGIRERRGAVHQRLCRCHQGSGQHLGRTSNRPQLPKRPLSPTRRTHALLPQCRY